MLAVNPSRNFGVCRLKSDTSNDHRSTPSVKPSITVSVHILTSLVQGQHLFKSKRQKLTVSASLSFLPLLILAGTFCPVFGVNLTPSFKSCGLLTGHHHFTSFEQMFSISHRQECICGQSFDDAGAFTRHKRKCSKGKKRLADVLSLAKESHHAKKYRIEGNTPTSSSHTSNETVTTVTSHPILCTPSCVYTQPCSP